MVYKVVYKNTEYDCSLLNMNHSKSVILHDTSFEAIPIEELDSCYSILFYGYFNGYRIDFASEGAEFATITVDTSSFKTGDFGRYKYSQIDQHYIDVTIPKTDVTEFYTEYIFLKNNDVDKVEHYSGNYARYRDQWVMCFNSDDELKCYIYLLSSREIKVVNKSDLSDFCEIIVSCQDSGHSSFIFDENKNGTVSYSDFECSGDFFESDYSKPDCFAFENESDVVYHYHVRKINDGLLSDRYSWRLKCLFIKNGINVETYSRDNDFKIRAMTALYGYSHEDLKNDDSSIVRLFVLNAGYDASFFVFDSEEVIREAIVEKGLYLDSFIDDSSWKVRAAVVRMGYKTELFVNDPELKVKFQLIDSGFELDRLVKDPNVRVRMHMVNKGLMLDRLINDPEKAIRVLANRKLQKM